MTLTNVPTLDEIAQDPTKIRDLSPAVAFHLLAQLAQVQVLLLARAVAPVGHGREEGTEDRLLTVAEAATKLAVPRQFAYELARRGEIPTIRLGEKHLRVPLRALKKLLDGDLSNLYNTPRKARRYANGRGRTAEHSKKARPDPDGNG